MHNLQMEREQQALLEENFFDFIHIFSLRDRRRRETYTARTLLSRVNKRK